MSKTIDINEHLEAVEGLLTLCSNREKQINNLIEENRALKELLDKNAVGTPAESNIPRFDTPSDCKVLIISDSEIMLNQLGSLFVAYGYDVVGKAHDRQKALANFIQNRPSLVALDTGIEDEDSFVLTKSIRSIDPNVLIILISGKISDVGVLKAIQAGASDIITKPLNSDRLMQIIQADKTSDNKPAST